ncbi:MAG: hypothetical protein WD038_00950 [Balneolales bacterium]
MNKLGEIEIKVTGRSGNEELAPKNYDIKHIAALLLNVEDLLHPTSKKDRPLITYDIQEGSVKHIFKTSLQAVIGFSAILGQVQENQTIDFLEIKTARALEDIQNLSLEKYYTFEIKTSSKEESELIISPETHFFRTENVWVDAEFYFYGVLKDAGGKNKANIHLDTDDFGYIAIETGINFLEGQKENLLYKKYGVRAKGKQNSETGEVDTKSLSLIQLIDYTPTYDEDYLNSLIRKAKKNWKGIDPDEWLSGVRGDYEA